MLSPASASWSVQYRWSPINPLVPSYAQKEDLDRGREIHAGRKKISKSRGKIPRGESKIQKGWGGGGLGEVSSKKLVPYTPNPRLSLQ